MSSSASSARPTRGPRPSTSRSPMTLDASRATMPTSSTRPSSTAGRPGRTGMAFRSSRAARHRASSVDVARVPGSPAAEVLGQISKDDKTSLTGKAVALAALQDTATGRLVAWTAITPTSQVPIDFRLGFDPATVDPAAPLGAWAAIVDGTSVWQSDGTQPLVAADDQLSAGTITVAGATSVPLPPKPTPTPSRPPAHRSAHTAHRQPEPTPVTVPRRRGPGRGAGGDHAGEQRPRRGRDEAQVQRERTQGHGDQDGPGGRHAGAAADGRGPLHLQGTRADTRDRARTSRARPRRRR